MAGLTKEEIAEYRSVFNTFDADGSGAIDEKELKQALDAMGYKPSDDDVKAMIAEVDADRSGKIEWSEFLKSLERKPKKQHKEAELRKAFKEIDTDGNGGIDAKELRSLLEKMGVSDCVSQEDIEKMIEEVDCDKDGKVQYEEFLAMWHG